MNQSQLKYARERAMSIKRKKIAQISEKFRVQGFTDKEKLKALRDGDFTIKKLKAGSRILYVSEIISFNGEPVEDRKGKEEAQAKLEADFQVLMDEMVLGDNEAALALLRDFEGS